MIRYIRAVIKALRLTIQGEQLPYQPLLEWIDQGQTLAQAAIITAEQAGFDKAKRAQITVKADGREQSLDVILTAVKYHLEQEYPYLMQNLTEHSITAIYASNMNDQHLMHQLRNHNMLQDSPLEGTINALGDHLNSIPSSTEL